MVDYLAVLVSAVVAMIFGSVFYGALFGKTWMRLMKFSDKQMKAMKKKGMGMSYFWMFVGLLISAWVLSLFVNYLEASTFMQGMGVGFLVWFGFLATN